jgi:hypothetical protein
MPQFLGLTAALLCPLTMFVGLFVVLRTPALKWRIAWAVLCFIGVGAFWMRASDGPVGLRAGGVQHPWAQASRRATSKATAPLGAIAAMFVCVSVQRAQKAAAARRQAEPAPGQDQPS